MNYISGEIFSSLFRLCIPEDTLQSLSVGYYLAVVLPILGGALGKTSISLSQTFALYPYFIQNVQNL